MQLGAASPNASQSRPLGGNTTDPSTSQHQQLLIDEPRVEVHELHRHDGMASISASASNALQQKWGNHEEDDLFVDHEFPNAQSDRPIELNEGDRGSLRALNGLLWLRPNEIVQRIQQQQLKAHRASRPQQQQQQQDQQIQQQTEKTAILFSSVRIASTVAYGILASHAFAAVASGLAASNPPAIRDALLHPEHWRSGIFRVAFFRSGERELVSIDTRLPCRLAQQPKEHSRRSRCSSRVSSSETWRSRSGTRKETVSTTSARDPDGNVAAGSVAGVEGTDDTAGPLSFSSHTTIAKQKTKRSDRNILEATEAQTVSGDPPIEFAAFSLGNCFLTCVARGADVEKDNILPDRHYTIIDVVRVRILNSLTAPKTLLATDHFPLWPFNLV
ncbi:hypothetical protein, conserved [Eimeria tenella]|uniref:Calpain catalytic domain-containing protein n=1 Tax=Eimeria tenella TaxID=5802 RepID=U6KNC8_EIMTE|nr:hypothetical protein, conserved [Eimeria tenella]CDJ36948.1 hypothetical protein, conserved [Eimeria tenella]|eukprot:XP_013227786.1 hypothetical protein, conserved [Eimeria tenella]